MQHRHFLVKEEDGDYKLREIDAAIAQGISLFGIITGDYHAIESVNWTFYFMNCKISNEHANIIAEELSKDFLSNHH